MIINREVRTTMVKSKYVKIYLQIFVTVAIYKTSNICFKKDHGIFLHIKKFKLNLLALLYLQW